MPSIARDGIGSGILASMLDSAPSLPQDPLALHRIIAQLHVQLEASEREQGDRINRHEYSQMLMF